MITIAPYQLTWPDEFLKLGGVLRQTLGNLALRIDHIGSTAVPGLAAKDRIDIQVTVESLGPAVEQALNRVGYRRIERITGDHIPAKSVGPADNWIKWIFKPSPTQRPTNLHVRLAGRANQRYALLFRDFLRTHPEAAQSYGQVKQALARYHADDIEAYLDVKDPVCDIIISGAEVWATTVEWTAGPTDC